MVRTPRFKALHWPGLALVGALSFACGEDVGDPTGSACPEDSTLSYESFGQPFMRSHCSACHDSGGPESPALSTLEQVQANIDAIDRAAAAGPDATNTAMPEGASVSTEERRKLGQWLACGAP